MELIIKDESGNFKIYLQEFIRDHVNKYIKFKKELIYLPEGTNWIVADGVRKLISPRVKSVEITKAKSGNYCLSIKYKPQAAARTKPRTRAEQKEDKVETTAQDEK